MRTARLVGLSPDGKSLIVATESGEELAIVGGRPTARSGARRPAATRTTGDRDGKLTQPARHPDADQGRRDPRGRRPGGGHPAGSGGAVRRPGAGRTRAHRRPGDVVLGPPQGRDLRSSQPPDRRHRAAARAAGSTSTRSPGTPTGWTTAVGRSRRTTAPEKPRGTPPSTTTCTAASRWPGTTRPAGCSASTRPAKGPQPGRRPGDRARAEEDDTEPTLDLSDDLALVRATQESDEPTVAVPRLLHPVPSRSRRA